ncbi:SulP family inorganic anion transporter [Reichenbachiella versicolor]|uniref:SulP family inorganic anion transporter n=1 Tax=Reichenbachiella versicolor TaxID=1821036 RepID=UPI000D6E6176|nr:SulP family inorganic anion transporter [Reichenbachiella versicolor]
MASELYSNGLISLKKYWKQDVLSGFMVSLIALPLCLGIALASGVPPMAGLIAAIVGGLFMSRVTGSYVTISGPAAGLIVVNLGAVESLGAMPDGSVDMLLGYKYALAAFVVAGIIQLIFGFLKVGKFGDFFPTAAVHGMLAAIGVIIIVKQLFVALDYTPEKGGHGIIGSMLQIPDAFVNMNPEIAIIALSSIFILVIHPHIKFKPVKMIPAPMWVIICSIPFSHIFDLFHEHDYKLVGHKYHLGPKNLVHLPEKIVEGFVLPDFDMAFTGVFWVAVISVALVSSIESLLSASAVDTLDPHYRKSNLNRDVSSMGGGSALSAMIGGLPMISEIVRSTANITNGGKTQWANFFHGGFLLLFLLFGKPIIEQIPLAALAAMLIHVGFRLASPTEFKHIYEIGKEQLLIFITTLLTVLATDLIIGVLAGILMQVIIHLYYGAPLRFLFKSKFDYTEHEDKNQRVISLHHSAIFSNYISLKSEIEKHREYGELVLDFSNVNIIDHTFRTHLHDLQKEWEGQGKKLKFTNVDHLIPVSDHPLATKIKGDLSEEQGRKLTKHQQYLNKIADMNHWRFLPGKTISFEDFEGFSFSNSSKIVYAQNIISGEYEGERIIYSEIIYDKTLDTKSADSRLSALLIQSEKNLPVFTVEKEDFFDKVTDLAYQQDIDFDEYPVFSNKFVLKGPNEEEIRDFFHRGLIRKIEENPHFHIESNGKAIILYSFEEEEEKVSLNELIRFGKILALIH